MQTPRSVTAPQTLAAQLEGFVGLGMKKEALGLVRGHLKAKRLHSNTFSAALNAILTLADSTKRWRPLVEAAYAKLSKRGKRQVRFMMLSFYCLAEDKEAASRFIPQRFVAPFWPVDLMIAIDTLLALGRLKEARPLVRKAIITLDSLTSPDGRAMLMSCIAAYFCGVREWETAIRLWEGLQQDRLMAESAIFGLIDLHLHRSLDAIRTGRASLDHLRQHPDPRLETVLPGHDAARWRKADARLDKVERDVRRVLSIGDRNCHHT